MNHSNKRLVLFLGAGASVDAGLPSAAEVTRHFENFSDYSSRPSALLIENLFRLVQVEIASQTGVPASSVDFEAVFGALLDAVEGRNVLSSKIISELLQTRFGRVDLEQLVQDFVLYVRGLFLPIRGVEYLDGLLNTVWDADGTIATLNYDVCVERRHRERNRPIKTGFGTNGRWKGFDTEETGTELLKLHGSVHWLRPSVKLDDPYSILCSLVLFSEPIQTPLHKTAAWVATEDKPGARLLMNIGISKEQLYLTRPFDEIVGRLRAKLQESDVNVIAGYSFRDPAVNRIILESVRRKRVPYIVIDPYVERLRVDRPVLRALWDYGVLLECPKSVKDVSKADVGAWLDVQLVPPPDDVRVPAGYTHDSFSQRVHHLIVELSLLEYYLRLTLREIREGRDLPYGLLHCLIQSLERCRETYAQALV